jgi:hypothetical protein
MHFEAEGRELLGHEVGGTTFLEGGFGMGMNIAAPLRPVALELGDTIDDRHCGLPSLVASIVRAGRARPVLSDASRRAARPNRVLFFARVRHYPPGIVVPSLKGAAPPACRRPKERGASRPIAKFGPGVRGSIRPNSPNDSIAAPS